MQKRTKQTRAEIELIKDVFFIIVGAFVAIFLAQLGFVDNIISVFSNPAVVSFIAGIFFTSAFTLAPSAVVLARLTEHTPLGVIAFWGALGAMCGDLILFFFIKDRFADDLINSMRPSLARHIFSSFHLGFMKWLSPFLGALIIASPLPDEFGLALMGISEVRALVLMPISFAMNVLGIYSIVWFGSIM
jgi:hypothetical protein